MAVIFNDKQMQEIERLALLNCNSNTIAEAVGVAINTLKRHCGRKLRHWHAIYKVNLRQSQEKLKETSPDMAKFLGKNTLGQVDKQEVKTIIDSSLAPTEAERGALQAAADAYKRSIARQHNIKLKQA